MRAAVALATLALLVAGAPAAADSSTTRSTSPSQADTPVTPGERSGAATARDTPRPTVVRTKARSLRKVRFSDSRPVAGSRVRVTGRTTAKPRRVVLQTRVGATWKRVARTTARQGHFGFTLRSVEAGTRSYRVVVPRVRTKAQRQPRAVSPRVVLKVRGATPVEPPATDQPSADPAAAVTAELDRLVRAYRLEQGRTDVVGTNDCLADWATGHAARMASTGIFAHSGSSEWTDFGVVRAEDACEGAAPTYRAEAIDFVAGDDPARVAAAVLADWQAAWMHDEVLLDDFGVDRTLSLGAAPGLGPVAADGSRTPVWYVVAVVARNLP